MRSRVLLRRRWPAALGLGAAAGIGGGLALATIAGDTGSAVETYVDRVDAPDGMAVYCPPGMDTDHVDPAECLRYEPEREVEHVGHGAVTECDARAEHVEAGPRTLASSVPPSHRASSVASAARPAKTT